MFYGFAEVPDWRAFQRFAESGEPLKTVRPLFRVRNRRPGWATHWLENGVYLRTIQMVLRHADLEHATVYR